MTTPDIYTIEARRLTANSLRDEGFANIADAVLRGDCDSARDQRLLTATLRELNWQPPVDPDLIEARKIAADVCARCGNSDGAALFLSGTWDNEPDALLTLTAIKRGRELAAQERGA